MPIAQVEPDSMLPPAQLHNSMRPNHLKDLLKELSHYSKETWHETFVFEI